MIVTYVIVGLLLAGMVAVLYRLYRESGPWRREDWGILVLILVWSVIVALIACFIGAP